MPLPVSLKAPTMPVLADISSRSVAKMLWNQRVLIVAAWMVVSVAALIVVRQLPSFYRAEVLVLVDGQKIPDKFVSSTVEGNLSDSLALISQEIMSRTRLLRIIERFNLYAAERKTKTQEEIIQQMRQDISLKVEHGGGGGKLGAFRLSYQGKNPRVVAAVADQLAGLYVEENLRSRENQAQGTVAFLRSQLDRAKASLEAQESRVSEFKQRNNGTLPQQESALLSELGGLRIQLQGVQDNLDRAAASKLLLETTLASAQANEAALQASLRPRTRATTTSAAVTDWTPRPKSRVELLEGQLAALKVRYAADHPDVQAVARELALAQREEAEAEQRLAASKARTAANPANAIARDAAPATTTTTPELLREQERIATVKAQLETLTREMAKNQEVRERVLAQIGAAETRVGKLPLVEQQMVALTRDYEISKENYRSLLDKEYAADIATALERSQKSERFTVMDPAHIPEKPFKPKRAVIVGGCSLAGLLLGGLLGFGMEWRKSRIIGEWELAPDLLILGRVPLMQVGAPSGQ